ncbi:MAG TPA: OmpH family outer membrane protein, partial [Vicingus sp.]|nr:OmpH family outer membrane protein [Vicingus sp.]
MKNTSIILNIVLAIAIAILYYLHFSCAASCDSTIENEVATTVETEEAVPLGEINTTSNVGYINIDSLQDKYKLYEALIQKLKAKQTKYEAEISTKMIAFEKKVKDFQQKAATMSQFEGQTKQQELAEEEQKLYKLREDFTIKFQEEEAKLNDE